MKKAYESFMSSNMELKNFIALEGAVKKIFGPLSQGAIVEIPSTRNFDDFIVVLLQEQGYMPTSVIGTLKQIFSLHFPEGFSLMGKIAMEAACLQAYEKDDHILLFDGGNMSSKLAYIISLTDATALIEEI